MWLVCSARCGGSLFRALFTEVDLSQSGEYQDHRIVQEGYICLNCGAPAIDLRQVPAAMEADQEEDEPPETLDVLCPTCETPVTVVAGEDCPACGAALELAS